MNPQKLHLQAIYRDCECNLIPINPVNKKPLEGWKQWQQQRVEVDTLVRWSRGEFMVFGGAPWKYSGKLNYAVLTGSKPWSSIPGIIVLDADDDEAQAVVEKYCPPTPLVTKTPRGGVHYVYRMSSDSVRNRQKTRMKGQVYNLDVRGDGGYVLAPGSLKFDGGEYVASGVWTPAILDALPIYDHAWIPLDAPRLQVPTLTKEDSEEARRLLQEQPHDLRYSLARSWLRRQTGATSGKGADKYAFALGVRLVHGFGIDFESAVELFTEWGLRDDQQDENGNVYMWRASELRHKVKGALSVSYDSPGDAYVVELKAFLAWQREQQVNALVGQ